MTTQPLWRFSSFALGRRAARHSVASSLLLALIVAGLPALAGAQQTCRPDGDVDRNGSVTAADALLAFQQALSLAQLTACQQTIADVYPQPTAPRWQHHRIRRLVHLPEGAQHTVLPA